MLGFQCVPKRWHSRVPDILPEPQRARMASWWCSGAHAAHSRSRQREISPRSRFWREKPAGRRCCRVGIEAPLRPGYSRGPLNNAGGPKIVVVEPYTSCWTRPLAVPCCNDSSFVAILMTMVQWCWCVLLYICLVATLRFWVAIANPHWQCSLFELQYPRILL